MICIKAQKTFHIYIYGERERERERESTIGANNKSYLYSTNN